MVAGWMYGQMNKKERGNTEDVLYDEHNKRIYNK